MDNNNEILQALSELSDQIKGVETRLTVRLDKMDERLDKMDERFDRMDERLDKMDSRLGHIETSIELLTQENHENKVDILELKRAK